MVDRLKGFAFTKMNVDPFNFGRITPRDVILAMQANEINEKNEWEKIRVLAYYGLAPWQSKGFKPEQVVMPIDNVEKKPIKYAQIIKKK